MSLATWKKEFCPVSARSLLKKSWLARVERDLRKWEGLTQSNLMKHGLVHDHQRIIGGGRVFWIDGSTCSLCVARRRNECNCCPLYIVRGAVRCDWKRTTEKLNSYHRFIRFGNPHRMIYWLRRAKEMLEEKR